MIQLQNDFTTPKQSKRLLELGVPADSADCFITIPYTKVDTYVVDVLRDELYSKTEKFTDFFEYLPCWSVGRLIEIYLNSCKETDTFYVHIICSKPFRGIDYLMSCFEEDIDLLDFSKLED